MNAKVYQYSRLIGTFLINQIKSSQENDKLILPDTNKDVLYITKIFVSCLLTTRILHHFVVSKNVYLSLMFTYLSYDKRILQCYGMFHVNWFLKIYYL